MGPIRHPVVALAIGLGLFVVARPPHATAIGPFPTVLHPKEYVSPSGEFRLRVDPGERYGAGKATYRLTRQGVEVWAGERPFTLWDAGVADDGSAGGYAYSHGPTGGRDDGEFHVVLLDGRGAVRLDQVTKREPSRFLHTSPNPLAAGLIFDPANDRMVVRVIDADVNRGSEAWWVYRLSTAKPDGTFEPKARMADPGLACSVRDARAVPDTPLTLVHWWRVTGNWDNPNRGARFTLIDLTGKPVWTLDLPREYMRPGDEKAEELVLDEVRRFGAILDASRSARFDLRFTAEGQRVTFAVRRGENGAWGVRETGRRPSLPHPRPGRPPDPPELVLKRLGVVTLRTPNRKPAGAVRDIREFVIDGRGRPAFLRHEPDTGGTSFVLVGPDGVVVREVRLNVWKGQEECPAQTLLAWVGGDRFLVTRSPTGLEAKASAWWIDGTTGRVTAVEGFDCPAIDKLAGFPDGRFVALATNRWKHTMATTAHLFDARGRLVRRFPQGYDATPGVLFSPTDVAVTSDGKVVVLDVVRHDVTLFSGAGVYLRTVDLAKAWGRKPNYPADLSADADGGFVVTDFGGRPPVVRMSADGSVRKEWTARYADGRMSAGLQRVRPSPDGRLWATDGGAIVRLDDSGAADRVLGEPPDPDQLGEVAAVAVDPRGRVYAAAARSAGVHVFDAAGRHLYVCRPDPTDFGAGPVSPELSVADTGDVYLTAFDRPGEFLHFSPSGKRLGFEQLGKGEREPLALSQKWLPRPNGTGRWVLDSDRVRLADAKGEVVRVIERGPDRDWLESVQQGAVGPDGSLAVLAGMAFDGQGVMKLHQYDKDGNPIRTVLLPPLVDAAARIASNGERAAVSVRGGLVLLVGASGRVEGLFRPPQVDAGKKLWHPFLPARAGQLWLYDERSTIHRFTLP